MKAYIETLTATRNAMIAEYYVLQPQTRGFQMAMVAAIKQGDKERYSENFLKMEETADRVRNLQNAINSIGNAIGHLDMRQQPETFWG